MILRTLKQQYELLTSTDVVRAGRAAVQNAGLTLLQRMINLVDGEILDDVRFLGGALTPSASGADNVVTLRPGVVCLNTPLEGDDWIGLWQWGALEAPQGVAMPTNNDASGDDRVDTIALRFIDVEEDEQTTKIKDPITGNVSTETHPQRVRRDLEFRIFVGSPDPAPVAPTLPTGWYRVCDVVRQNGVVNVASTDITDGRQGGQSMFDELRILDAFSVAQRMWFGPHANAGNDALQLEADDPANPTILTLTKVGGGLASFITARIEATDYFNADKFIYGGASNPESYEFRTNADDDYAFLIAKNAPLSLSNFHFVDGGGGVSDNDPATVSYDYNIASIVYKDAAEDYALVTFDVPIPEAAATVAFVGYGQSFGGSAAPPSNNPSVYVEAGGATARIYWEGGIVPTNQAITLVVYGA